MQARAGKPALQPVRRPALHFLLVHNQTVRDLVNNSQEDSIYPRMDIYMLDIATLKLTKRFKMTAPIYGWAAGK